jgi:formate/nitrite transporter FocA (FNT family)
MALVVMFLPVIIIVACGFVYAVFKISAMAWLFLFSMCRSKWAEDKLENM